MAANEEQLKRMKELIAILEPAAKAYYSESREIMSNYEYDAYYDELSALEAATGTILAGSPTVRVGYEVVSSLPKERHASPMLSLNKTKSVDELKEWLGDHEGVMSWKMDGLTVVLTYEGGVLSKAVPRGNGEIGEVITPNARVFENLPGRIPFEGRLILRGESVISYPDFDKINQETSEEAKYKNPRNLCSGSVRALDSAVTASRHVRFYAFSLVDAEGLNFDEIGGETFVNEFQYLRSLGFETVEYEIVTRETMEDMVKEFSKRIETMEIPSDGLVLSYNDIAYGRSLGRTAKFPRGSIAFKWKDETAETTLLGIDWMASRTGLINPVAVFEPVELEGTVVQRASVHNVSILRQLKLGKGDRISVFKANMIIPQIAANLTGMGPDPVPEFCPVCGGATRIQEENDVQTLYCTNPDCPARQIKRFEQAVSREGLNIEGLSEATLETFIDEGLIRELADLYSLADHEERIVNLEGFGRRSYEKLMEAVERSRKSNAARFFFSLGVPGIGVANAKLLSSEFAGDAARMMDLSEAELSAVSGVGDVMARDWVEFFADPAKRAEAERLLACLELEQEAKKTDGGLNGMTFVITGSLEHFSNRNELVDLIESLGGKAASSVSKNTTALINNDVTSTSGKNKKAKELGIPIISEEEFLRRYTENAD